MNHYSPVLEKYRELSFRGFNFGPIEVWLNRNAFRPVPVPLHGFSTPNSFNYKTNIKNEEDEKFICYSMFE